ncbi:hypothetical protein KKG24_02015 [Patescibacteria group bacterium]|nr:hypothetical protein [Patescibacteria group bacterium]
MPKHFFEDMVRVKGNKKHTLEIKTKEQLKADVEIKYSNNKHRYLLWFVALISIIFCFFAFSFLFSRAEVSIMLKTKDVVLDKNLSASLDFNTTVLPFELTHLSGDASKMIFLEEKDLKEKAEGKVILYNKFSSIPQTLLIDTRLEGSNDKIYKTKTKVVIPGMSKDGTPGQTNVDIYASTEGAEYNSTPLDFKILGFKGTSKYAKFYGRSVGDITGGIVGRSRQVSDLQKMEIEKELKATLKNELFDKISNKIPGFLLYKDATFLSVEDFVIGPVASDGSVILTERGTLYGIIFNEHKLTQEITKDNFEKNDSSEVFIPNIKDLNFSLSGKENILFDSVKNINFNLSGSVKIVWELDVDKFTTDLLDKPKKDFDQILSQYTSINSALVKLSPPWIQSLPGKTKDIKVIVDYAK